WTPRPGRAATACAAASPPTRPGRRGRSPADRAGQPLSAPESAPTSLRWAKTNSASAGTIDSAVKANTAAVFCVYVDWNVATASGSGYFDWLVNTTSGSRYAFQLTTNAKIPTVVSAGRDSGTRMRRKNPNLPAPSTTAASSS